MLLPLLHSPAHHSVHLFVHFLRVSCCAHKTCRHMSHKKTPLSLREKDELPLHHQESGVLHHESAKLEEGSKNVILYKPAIVIASFVMIVTFLFPDTESARTEGKRVTSPVGATACHSYRGVCVHTCVSVGASVSACHFLGENRTGSWSESRQQALASPLQGSLSLPREQEAGMCVSLTLPAHTAGG